MAVLAYLRQEILSSDYRARHQGRKERKEKGIFEPCARRRHLAFVNIYYIADGLKSIERYPHRKRKLERLEIRPYHGIEIPHKEIGIFEIYKYAERSHQRQRHARTPLRTCCLRLRHND